MERRALVVIGGVVGVALVAFAVVQSGLWVDIVGVGEYDGGTVTVRDGNETATAAKESGATTTVAVQAGDQLATVDVRISDTFEQRYTGLSDTESLEPDEGMLFVHEQQGSYAYVMRDMAFPLDIIFIDTNGTITTIHHAPLPPDETSNSDLRRYEGRGKYILEVNRGWTNQTGVSVGDTVELPAGVA